MIEIDNIEKFKDKEDIYKLLLLWKQCIINRDAIQLTVITNKLKSYGYTIVPTNRRILWAMKKRI